MSRKFPRKRHVQLPKDVSDTPSQASTATLFSGRHFRWLQKGLMRRTRLLFTLLRRYPIIALFILLIVWLGVRLLYHPNQRSLEALSASSFEQEFGKANSFASVDDELIERFGPRQLQSLTNFRETSYGIFMDVQLDGKNRGILKLFPKQTSHNSTYSEYQPRLWQLARLLDLSHDFLSTYPIKVQITQNEPLVDRHLAKKISRACGFRSPSKVPQGLAVSASVVPVDPDSLHYLTALRTPTVEPYEWRSNFPTSRECGHGMLDKGGNGKRQILCQRLTEIMVVMYLGGCAPPENVAFVAWRGDAVGDEEALMVAFANGCFGKYQDNSIVLDIAVAFLGKTCSLPSGLLGRINGMLDTGWGVGDRAKKLKRQIELLNREEGGLCRRQGWKFYANSSVSHRLAQKR